MHYLLCCDLWLCCWLNGSCTNPFWPSYFDGHDEHKIISGTPINSKKQYDYSFLPCSNNYYVFVFSYQKLYFIFLQFSNYYYMFFMDLCLVPLDTKHSMWSRLSFENMKGFQLLTTQHLFLKQYTLPWDIWKLQQKREHDRCYIPPLWQTCKGKCIPACCNLFKESSCFALSIGSTII